MADITNGEAGSSVRGKLNVNMLEAVSVVTTGSTITCDMGSRASRIFNGLTSFATDKSITLSNATNAQFFTVNFQTTAALKLTFPSNFRSSDTRFAALELDLPMPGYYDISATYDAVNSIWKLRACEDGGVV